MRRQLLLECIVLSGLVTAAASCGPAGPAGEIVWKLDLDGLKEVSTACDSFRDSRSIYLDDPASCDRLAVAAFVSHNEAAAIEVLSELCESRTGLLSIPTACRFLGAIRDRRGERDEASRLSDLACESPEENQMYYEGSSNCRATGDRYEILGTAAFEAEVPKLTALERRLSTCYYLDMVARSGVGDVSAALVPLTAQAHFKKARRAWSDGCRWELDLGACQGLQDKYRSCLEDYTSYCRSEPTGLAKAELEKVQACEYMLRILPEDIASMDRHKEQTKSDADSVASVKANIWRMRAQAEAAVQQAWGQFAVDLSQQLSTAAAQIAQNEQTIAAARAAAAQRPAAPSAATAPPTPSSGRPPSASAASPVHTAVTCPTGQREVAPGKCACPIGSEWIGDRCVEVARAPETQPPQPPSTSGPSASSPQAPPPAQRQPDCTGMQGCLEISGPSAEESSYCKVNERGEKTYLPSVRNKCSVKLACKLCGSYPDGLRDCVEWYWEPEVTHGGWASPLVWCDTTTVVAWCVRDEEIENRSCLTEVP